MKITFADVQVGDLCCCKKNLIRQFGIALADKICGRLSMLAAASSLEEIPESPPVDLASVDGSGVFSVALGADHVLLFKAAAKKKTVKARDFAKIISIQIIGPSSVLTSEGKRK